MTEAPVCLKSKYKMFQPDLDVCVNFTCVRRHHHMSNETTLFQDLSIEMSRLYNPPRLSQMHMDASGTIVTLWASQRSNIIVSHGSIKLDEVRLIETKWYEMTWSDMKWHEVTWSDIRWCEMTWSDIRWCEMTSNDMKLYEIWYEMKRKDLKGY